MASLFYLLTCSAIHKVSEFWVYVEKNYIKDFKTLVGKYKIVVSDLCFSKTNSTLRNKCQSYVNMGGNSTIYYI